MRATGWLFAITLLFRYYHFSLLPAMLPPHRMIISSFRHTLISTLSPDFSLATPLFHYFRAML